MAGRNILLIEPGYKNKYPPLGLMKIAQYHGPNGKRDNVKFIKGQDKSVLATYWDRIYITTLFSFEWNRIAESIDFALEITHGDKDRIFVGGIAASLMHEKFLAEQKWQGIRFISGLLDKPPAEALQLDDFAEELYSDDTDGPPIEDLIPDYSILDHVEYKYPVHDAYFAYASRGCIRKCNFCGVPKLEGAQRDTPSITSIVRNIEKLYGPKKDLVLMDNNVVASPRFKEIIAEIRDLGFVPGAKLPRGRASVQRRVDFNQGVDARILSKDKMFLRELSSICLKPLRIAFDHWGLREPYEKAVRYAHEFGLNDLSNYMLYNFHDSPADLYLRTRLNVELNEQLGIRIWSFPMRYQPTNLPNRSHVGEKWNRYYLRSVQIVLQATQGLVSGEPDFFREAFGENMNDFESILLRPHHFIFHRHWYTRYGGRAEFEEYTSISKRLSSEDKARLLAFLSARDPSKYKLGAQELSDSSTLRAILPFYFPPGKAVENQISKLRKEYASKSLHVTLSNDEIVEDAGLEADDAPKTFVKTKSKQSTRRVAELNEAAE